MPETVSQARRKRVNLLLLVFVVLIVAVVFLVKPFGLFKPDEKAEQAKDPTQKELVALDKDAISAFEIKNKDEDAFRIEKEGEQWYLKQGDKKYRAYMERVDKLLEDLPHLRSEALVTSTEDKYKDLEVDDAAGTVLSIFAGGDTPKLKLTVGKSGPGYNSAFVRVDGGKEVYRAGKSLKTDLGFPFTDWRNKNPWQVDQAAVTELSIAAPPAKEEAKKPEAPAEKGKKDAKTPAAVPAASPAAIGAVSTFKKGAEYWQNAEGKNAGQNAVKEFLKSLSELNINQFVDAPDPAKTGLANAKPAITIVSAQGTLTLSIGAKENSQYYVKDQDGIVYQISEYNLRFYTDVDLKNLNLDDTPKEEPKDAKKDEKDAGKDSKDAPKEEKEPSEGKQEDKKSETDE